MYITLIVYSVILVFILTKTIYKYISFTKKKESLVGILQFESFFFILRNNKIQSYCLIFNMLICIGFSFYSTTFCISNLPDDISQTLVSYNSDSSDSGEEEYERLLDISDRHSTIFTNTLVGLELQYKIEIFANPEGDYDKYKYLSYLVNNAEEISKSKTMKIIQINDYFELILQKVHNGEMLPLFFNLCVKEYVGFLTRSFDNVNSSHLSLVEKYTEIFNDLEISKSITIKKKLDNIEVNSMIIGQFRNKVISIPILEQNTVDSDSESKENSN